MRKKLVPLVVVAGFGALVAVVAGCHRSSSSTASSDTLQKLQANSGFAAQVPADVEALISFYNSGELIQNLQTTKLWAEVMAIPAVRDGLAKSPFVPKPGQSPSEAAYNQNLARAKSISGALLGSESFLVLTTGAAEQFTTLQQLQQPLQSLAMMNTTGHKTSPAMMTGYYRAIAPQVIPLLQKAAIPSMWFGFKASAQKKDIDDGLNQLIAKKPAAVKAEDFQLAGKYPFHLFTFTVRDGLDANQQTALKAQINTTLDPGPQADAALEAILSRHVEMAVGWVGDYLLVSLGAGHDHLKLVDQPGDSVLARKELEPLAPLQHTGFHTLAYSSEAFLKTITENQWNIAPILQRLKDRLASIFPQALPQEDSARIDTEIQQFSAKFKTLGPQKVSASVGAGWWDHGLHLEAFGGPEYDALQSGGPLNFASIPDARTFLWSNKRVNPAYVAKVLDVLDYSFPVAWGELHRFVIDRLPPEKKQPYAMVEQLALPKLQELYRITKEELLPAQGDEAALSLDFDGAVPVLPMIPGPLATSLKLPRVAIVRELKDRAELQKSAASYGAWLKDVTALLPPQGQMIFSALQLASKSENNVDYTILTLPLNLGDFAPQVAVTPKWWLLTNSTSQANEIATKLAQPTPGTPAGFVLHLSMPVACDYAQRWANAMKQFPDFFGQAKGLNAQQVTQNADTIQLVIRYLRVIGALDIKCDVQNGLPHTSSQLEFQDLP
ncbi:MAG: hypothetical protein QM796_00080 [Chthoniobacteraceae bacterium]